MNSRYYLILLIIGFFMSCAHRDNVAFENFIHQYGDKNFIEFKNYSLFIRSYEERGRNVCIMATNDEDTGTCSVPFAYIIEKESFRILETRRSTGKEQQCKLDTLVAGKLAIELLKMGIDGIAIDTNNTVFVNVVFREDDRVRLVRFSDRKFVTGIYQTHYEPIGANWYKRK